MASSDQPVERIPSTGGRTSARSRKPVGRRFGVLCTVFGAVAAMSLAWLWTLTLPGFNPPNWIRIAGLAWLPIGVVGSVLTGIIAGRQRSSRSWVVTGLALTTATVVGFIALIQTAE